MILDDLPEKCAICCRCSTCKWLSAETVTKHDASVAISPPLPWSPRHQLAFERDGKGTRWKQLDYDLGSFTNHLGLENQDWSRLYKPASCHVQVEDAQNEHWLVEAWKCHRPRTRTSSSIPRWFFRQPGSVPWPAKQSAKKTQEIVCPSCIFRRLIATNDHKCIEKLKGIISIPKSELRAVAVVHQCCCLCGLDRFERFEIPQGLWTSKCHICRVCASSYFSMASIHAPCLEHLDKSHHGTLK